MFASMYISLSLSSVISLPDDWRYARKKSYWKREKLCHDCKTELTLYLIDMPFNAFANRADPDQAALVRAA